jgi:hypothetical protein
MNSREMVFFKCDSVQYTRSYWLVRTAAGRVEDLKHFYADPDPDFHCNTVPDSDPALHFNADPDPASHKSGTNLQPLVY